MANTNRRFDLLKDDYGARKGDKVSAAALEADPSDRFVQEAEMPNGFAAIPAGQTVEPLYVRYYERLDENTFVRTR